ARLWPQAAARSARRLRLADAIDEQTRAQSLPALRTVIADRDEAAILRGAAAVLLVQRFPAELDVVTPLLADPSPLLRPRPAEARGSAGDRRVAAAALAGAAALARDPSLAVRQARAIALTMLGDADDAAPAIDALLADPDGVALAQPHLAAAMLAMGRRDPAAAARELEQVIARVPYHVDALLMLANLQPRHADRPRRRPRAPPRRAALRPADPRGARAAAGPLSAAAAKIGTGGRAANP